MAVRSVGRFVGGVEERGEVQGEVGVKCESKWAARVRNDWGQK